MRNYLETYLPTFSRLLLTVLFFQIPLLLFSQNIHFERIPNELGLSQNLISALYQDRDGFLWVGTKDGLNRFDGYKFEVYQNDPFDSTSISDNYIFDIYEDRQGRLWIATSAGLNLLDRRSGIFCRLLPPPAAPPLALPITENYPGLSSKTINVLLEDREGNIWIGTQNGGLVKMELPPDALDFAGARFTVFMKTATENSLWEKSVHHLAQDESGAIWANSAGTISIVSRQGSDGAYQIKRLHWSDFDPKWDGYDHADFLYVVKGEGLPDEHFYSVFSDPKGAVWMKTAGGFAKWKPFEKRFQLFSLDVDLEKYKEGPLAGANGIGVFDQQGQIWIGGVGALVVYDTLTHKIVLHNQAQEESTVNLPDVGLAVVTEDRAGNIWVGSNGKGLYKYSPQLKKFGGKYGVDQWNGGSVRCIYETSDGTVWLGLTNLQLLRWDRKTGVASPVILEQERWPRPRAAGLDYFFTMQEDAQGNLWLGSELGLFRFQRKGKDIEKWDYYQILRDQGKGEPGAVIDMCIDRKGQIWLLNRSEFGRFDPATGYFDGHNYLAVSGGERLPNTFPCIFQQDENTFWLGTDEGLLKFDAGQAAFTFYTNDARNPNSLSQRQVKCIHPDPASPDQVLWIGTGGGGLNRFDLTTGRFTHFKKKDGLPDNVVYGILDDGGGNLWLSTNQGISKFNPRTGQFKNYSTENGLQDNEFNSGAYFKSKSGELFFGGINGVNAFWPASIKDNLFEPKVKITSFKLANKAVDFKTPGSPLKQPITETTELVLTWRDKIFSFEFASLDLSAPERNQYAYRLEGFHDDWQYIGTERTATFTNLNPGKYTLRVKATNHDGVWNEEGTSLKITILPPWWATWWAYLAYVLVLGASAFLFYKFQLNRKLEHAEAVRLKELDSLKTRLYTNITHEFRTPLTVILGNLEMMKLEIDQVLSESPIYYRESSISQFLISKISIIRRNSKNLLRLINQMLDLSKLDAGTMKMELVKGDLINYLQYLTESFHSMAFEKKIQLTFYSEIEELVMDFDEVKIQHIIYNLLSNALKFTGAGGKVVLHASQTEHNGLPCLKLKIKDTGVGIAAHQLAHIFDRFYQADNTNTRKGEGTGIGLALTKELVELMGGHISAQSEPGKGTTFTILLPATLAAGTSTLVETAHAPENLAPELAPDPVPSFGSPRQVPLATPAEEKPLLLIIEDNVDVVNYIASLLEKDYAVHIAPDGQAGMEKAFEMVPDIIISDVMMPEKDGYEVCETLKNDARTSHIPIILLTAKAEEADRITGLRKGADAYLMKPFNKEELFVRLEKLVALRRALQKRYAGEGFDKLPKFVKSDVAVEPTLEDIFLQKIKEAIDEKIDDTELGIQDLCRAVNLSHTQVFRKLKALTGENPTLFIRKMRLHKALELLKTTDRNVSEIAYEVGFSDPNYFSRVFHEEFGAPPSEMRN
ncbi:MAG: response regulator [Saprospiraceae bacterium]|nr:response regulator [Saprospiraceae bacterium]